MLKNFVRPVMGGFEPPPTPPPEYATDTDRRQMDGRRHIANLNLSSRSLKTLKIQTLDSQSQQKIVAFQYN